jgi:hypothetical protein
MNIEEGVAVTQNYAGRVNLPHVLAFLRTRDPALVSGVEGPEARASLHDRFVAALRVGGSLRLVLCGPVWMALSLVLCGWPCVGGPVGLALWGGGVPVCDGPLLCEFTGWGRGHKIVARHGAACVLAGAPP